MQLGKYFWIFFVTGILTACGGGGTYENAIPSAAELPAIAEAMAEPQVATSSEIDAFFNWVPMRYSQHFSGTYTSGTSAPYTYRYFPSTQNFVAVSGSDVYILGPVSGGVVQKVGPLSQFACEVNPVNCSQVPVVPAAPTAASMAGYYTGTPNGPTPNGTMIVDETGRFVGVFGNASNTKVDYFAGAATTGGRTWSSTAARYVSVLTTPIPFSSSGFADFSGTFTPAERLVASIATRNVSAQSRQLDMTYASLSNEPSSLARVGGTYRSSSTGQNVTIDPSNGVITGAYDRNCSISGAIAVQNPQRNVYLVNIELSGPLCTTKGRVDGLASYLSVRGYPGVLVAMGYAATQYGIQIFIRSI